MPDCNLIIVLVNWQAFTALATLAYAVAASIAVLIAVVTGCLILFQLKSAEKTRRASMLNHIYEQFHVGRSKQDRYTIYRSNLRKFTDEDFNRLWSKRKHKGLDLKHVERTSDQMHYIGLLVHRNLADIGDLFEYFMWPALLSYRHMGRYIDWVRANYNPRYSEHFIRLIPHLEDRFKTAYLVSRRSRLIPSHDATHHPWPASSTGVQRDPNGPRLGGGLRRIASSGRQ